MKQNNFKLGVKTPPDLVNKMLGEALFKENYGLHGRSKWVEEAIISLLQLDPENYADLICLDNTFNATLKQYTFLVSPNTRNLIDGALIEVKKRRPSENVSVSAIIRTAILQRLIRNKEVSPHGTAEK